MTQNQQIIEWLTPMGRTIDPLTALNKFGIFRLASRINEISKTHSIKSEMVTNKKTGKRYAKYSLL